MVKGIKIVVGRIKRKEKMEEVRRRKGAFNITKSLESGRVQVEFLRCKDIGESGRKERMESKEESGAPLGESGEAFFGAMEVSCTLLNQVGFWILVLSARILNQTVLEKEIVPHMARAHLMGRSLQIVSSVISSLKTMG